MLPAPRAACPKSAPKFQESPDMSARSRAAVSSLVLAVVLALAPAAQARPADAAAAAQKVKRAKLRLSTLSGVPAAVTAGNAFRVRGRVVNLPRRMAETARLTFSLRTSMSAK